MLRGIRLGIGWGITLLALIALCPIPNVDEAHAAGQGTSIGVKVQRLGDDMRDRMNNASGVLVVGVASGSLAEQAGIVKGDVLVVVGSVTLREPDDLGRAESRIVPGQPVSVVVVRDGGRLIKMMKLAPPDPEDTAIDPEPPASGEEELKVPSDENAPSADRAVQTPTARTTVAPVPVTAVTPAPEAAQDQKKLSGLARVGVHAQDLSPDLAAALGLPRGRGVLVLEVTERGPAALAGVRAGDVITQVGDQRIFGVEHLGNVVANASGPLSVTVKRRGVERIVDLQLEESPTVVTIEKTAPDAGLDSSSGTDRDRELNDLRDEVRKLAREVRRLQRELDDRKNQDSNSY